jgi:hypothetical protein
VAEPIVRVPELTRRNADKYSREIPAPPRPPANRSGLKPLECDAGDVAPTAALSDQTGAIILVRH